jgi:hypothetical protein
MPVTANAFWALLPLVGHAGLPLAAGEGISPLWIAIGVGAVVIVAGIALYNQLVAMTVRADNAWSDIDVQLKRRHDLVPNVVEAVKGYAGYEKETLEAVVAARAKAMGAATAGDAAAAENVLSGALKSLFALAESYPDLKASSQFTHLQQQLAASYCLNGAPQSRPPQQAAAAAAPPQHQQPQPAPWEYWVRR